MTWTGPKQFGRAKVALRSRACHLEDFHEVRPHPTEDDEVLYRIVQEAGVQYRVGSKVIGEYVVRNDLLSSFAPFDSRQNVHELDKFIGVCRILRATLDRNGTRPYPYLASIRDTMAVRALDHGTAARLW